MAIYNLEETPNIFIDPKTYDDKFLYRMSEIEGNNRKIIRSIDLRNDKLKIYGTEIQESLFQRLFDSLTLRLCLDGVTKGGVYVNCSGACYIEVIDENVRRYTTIHNVIFDWSPFGVIVPHTLGDSLKKELDQKEATINGLAQELAACKVTLNDTLDESRSKEVEHQKVNTHLCNVSSELHSTKDQLVCSNNKVEELESRVLNLENDSLDKELRLSRVDCELIAKQSEIESMKDVMKGVKMEFEMKLQKACEKIALIDFEVELYKIELESCNKEVDQLLDEVCNYKKDRAQMEEDIQKMHERNRQLEKKSSMLENELVLVRSELQSTKDQRESLGENVKILERELSNCENCNRGMKEELQTVRDQLIFVRSELKSTKDQRELLDSNVKLLEERCLTCEDCNQDMKHELEGVQDQLLKANEELIMVRSELLSTKDQRESLDENVKVLEERLSNMENRNRDMKGELVKVQDQLWMANKEVRSNVTLLESSRKEVEELEAKIGLYEKEKQCIMQKIWDQCFSPIRSIWHPASHS